MKLDFVKGGRSDLAFRTFTFGRSQSGLGRPRSVFRIGFLVIRTVGNSNTAAALYRVLHCFPVLKLPVFVERSHRLDSDSLRLKGDVLPTSKLSEIRPTALSIFLMCQSCAAPLTEDRSSPFLRL
jgi:hypothetical protein